MYRRFVCPIISLLVLGCTLPSCRTENLFAERNGGKMRTDSIFHPDHYEYRIRKDDKINIGIWNNDDISVGSVYGIYNSGEGYGKWLMVDANGEIAVPRLGNFAVEGMTLRECRLLLISALSKTIRSPVIDLKVLNREVTVLGEVRNPGKIHLEKESNTLVDILGLAGDFDLYGDRRHVKVIRRSGAADIAATVDLTKLDRLAVNNILVHPGDIVYVPARRRKSWDKTASATIVPAASAVTAILLIFKTFF